MGGAAEQRNGPRPQNHAAYGWLGLAAVSALTWVQTQSATLNADAAYFLLSARGLAEGRVLYDTYADFNLPANVWLASLSLFLSHALGMSLANVHQTVLWAIISAGAALLVWVVLQITAGRRGVALLFPGLAAAALMPVAGDLFGQREMLFLACASPWMAVVAGRHVGFAPSLRLSWLVSLAAAAGASLKPHFWVLCAGVGGLALLLARGRWRQLPRELWQLAGLTVLHLATIAWLYPTYLTRVLPLAAKTYAPLGKSWAGVWEWTSGPMMGQAIGGLFVLVLGVAILRKLGRATRAQVELATAGLALVTVAAVIYVGQRQGFSYHLHAVTALATLMAVFVLTVLLEGWRTPHRLVLGLLWVLPLCSGLAVQVRRLGMRSGPAVLADPLRQALVAAGPEARVLALQTGVMPFSPVHAYADFHWAGTFGCLTELRAVVDHQDRVAAGGAPDPDMLAVEADMRRNVLLALTSPPPDVVYVDVSPHLRWFESYGRPAHVLEFLARDPRFVAVWRGYEKVGAMRTYWSAHLEIYERVRY